MDDVTLSAQLQALFKDTARAHHEAYRATDGADDEWPLWYADYLQPRLRGLLDFQATKSALVYLLVSADKQQKQQAPASDWTATYALFFLQQLREA